MAADKTNVGRTIKIWCLHPPQLLQASVRKRSFGRCQCSSSYNFRFNEWFTYNLCITSISAIFPGGYDWPINCCLRIQGKLLSKAVKIMSKALLSNQALVTEIHLQLWTNMKKCEISKWVFNCAFQLTFRSALLGDYLLGTGDRFF